MTDVERARQCETHLRSALEALAIVRQEVSNAGDAYPDTYAKPVYDDVTRKCDLLRAYLEALTIPAKAYRGEVD